MSSYGSRSYNDRGGSSRSQYDTEDLERKVYVGGLGDSAIGRESELERVFGYYGPLQHVWVARRPPGFAFVVYKDSQDAEDACRGLDGRQLCGVRVTVDMSSGKSRHKSTERCNHCGKMGHPTRECQAGSSSRRYRSRSPPPARRRRRSSYSRSRSYSPRGRRSVSPGYGSRSPRR